MCAVYCIIVYMLSNNAYIAKQANTMQNTNTNANTNAIANTIANTIASMLRPGTNMCTIKTCTPVALAAANKHNTVIKESVINVQLFNNINDFNVYANAVKRNAANNAANNINDVDNFTAQSNYFTHTNCFSIVKHKSNDTLYLYYIANSCSSSTYYINGNVANKNDVAALCTKSVANKMLNNNNETYNKANNVTHSVVVRTVKLTNVVSITANKQTINF